MHIIIFCYFCRGGKFTYHYSHLIIPITDVVIISI